SPGGAASDQLGDRRAEKGRAKVPCLLAVARAAGAGASVWFPPGGPERANQIGRYTKSVYPTGAVWHRRRRCTCRRDPLGPRGAKPIDDVVARSGEPLRRHDLRSPPVLRGTPREGAG